MSTRRVFCMLPLALITAIFASLLIAPGASAAPPAPAIRHTTAALGPAASEMVAQRFGLQPAPFTLTGTAPVAERVAIVAVTVPPGQQLDDVRVRQVDDSGPGEWQELHVEGGTIGTEPFVVVGARSVEVVATSTQLVDADLHVYNAPAAGGDVLPMASARQTNAWADPPIRSRASWGADERIVTLPYIVGHLQGAIIHHTVGSNTYSQADVPAILRGIQYYHVRTQGWIDIGYNVLVDRFGQAWQGRGGNINAHIEGGHTFGGNYETFGIAAMGTFDTATPPAAMLRTMEQVIAWKLQINRVDPMGTTLIVRDDPDPNVRVPAISGHRNAVATSCPGNALYNRLPSIRTNVRSIMNSKTFRFFLDVPVGLPFRNDIHWLGSMGVSAGWPDYTFRPVRPINRDAMAAFIYRLAGSPEYYPPAVSPFRDVRPTDQFYKEIAWMHATGVATGWSDRTYRATRPITRDAMAAFLYRLAGSPRYTPRATSPFTDIKPSSAFYKEMTWLREVGLTTGYPDRTYRPGSATNRDAMAAFMHRFYTKFGKPKVITPPTEPPPGTKR